MFRKLLAVAFFCGALAFPGSDERITGGTDAMDGEFPYIVSVRRMNQHICGGSILGPKYVLTAAHCVNGRQNDAWQFSIMYGKADISIPMNIISVSKIMMHENFVHGAGYLNDVAVLKLELPIPLGPDAQTVVLPDKDEEPADTKTVLAGWGVQQVGGDTMEMLQKVDVELVSDDICLKSEKFYNPIYHICAGNLAGGKGQCHGDSGGPLVFNGKQFGVVSYSRKPCASPNHAGVFAKVSNYVNWIKTKMTK